MRRGAGQLTARSSRDRSRYSITACTDTACTDASARAASAIARFGETGVDLAARVVLRSVARCADLIDELAFLGVDRGQCGILNRTTCEFAPNPSRARTASAPLISDCSAKDQRPGSRRVRCRPLTIAAIRRVARAR